MVIGDRDAQILEKLIKYCLEIEHAHHEYSCSYETFCANPTYRNAIALCLMQIGELAGKLSDDFRAANTQIPWRAIRGMRNVVAHEYGRIDMETVWETAENGTQELKEFCQKTLQEAQNQGV